MVVPPSEFRGNGRRFVVQPFDGFVLIGHEKVSFLIGPNLTGDDYRNIPSIVCNSSKESVAFFKVPTASVICATVLAPTTADVTWG